MDTSVLLWFLLLPSLIFCNGFTVHGPSGPLMIQLGESVMLPCSVKNPLPMNELEVEWKRNGSLVHWWQNGESQPESQNQRYRERAHFFSEEVPRGNFSLLLTNVTREDAGVYKCVVYTNQDSDHTQTELKIERLIVSGSHVISPYAGEDITLNCSVDSHIPSEKLEEVSWKRDGEMLVLLYQEGEVLTDSTPERFKDRVEFFSTEDRNKGNFSMRLKNVRTEDKGLYMCLVFSGDLSDNTTVVVQQLGFSSMHIGILFLCVLVIGSLIPSVIFQNNEREREREKKRDRYIQCALVFCPNIIMSIVFILWGVAEGFITEAATCSVVNFIRIVSLVWIAERLKSFQGFIQHLTNPLPVLLQYAAITVVAYLPIIVDFWHKTNTAGKGFILALFLFMILLHAIYIGFIVCRGRVYRSRWSGSIITELSNILRICVIIVIYGIHNNINLAALAFPILTMFSVLLSLCLNLFLSVTIMMILEIVSVSGTTYVNYDIVSDMKECGALTCVNVFFYILTMMTLLTTLQKISGTRDTDSESRNTVIQTPLWCAKVLMISSVLVVLVNVTAVLAELILKARNGERTVDLRLIVIPAECAFAVCRLALQIYTFLKENRKRLITDMKNLRELPCCGCKREPRDSNSHQSDHHHELQNLQAPQAHRDS